MSARMRLRRFDGATYLNRWGFEIKRIGGVFIHKMEAPDPGVDLHNHPWAFGSLILWGGYTEERTLEDIACVKARFAEKWDPDGPRGSRRERRWLTWRVTPLDVAHRIVALRKRTCWTLVVHGPWRRQWGFFEPDGFTTSREYATERRELWVET